MIYKILASAAALTATSLPTLRAADATAATNSAPSAMANAQATANTNSPGSYAYGKKTNEWFFRRFNEAFSEQSGTPVCPPPQARRCSGPHAAHRPVSV